MSKLTEEQLNEISKTVYNKIVSDSENQLKQAVAEISLDIIVEFYERISKTK